MLQSHKVRGMGPRQNCHVAAARNLPGFNLLGVSLVHIYLFMCLPPPGPQGTRMVRRCRKETGPQSSTGRSCVLAVEGRTLALWPLPLVLSHGYVTLHCKMDFADIIEVDLKLGRVSCFNQMGHISIVGALEKKGLSLAGRRGRSESQSMRRIWFMVVGLERKVHVPE